MNRADSEPRRHLRQRRQELDLTQTEVAKAIGVSQPTYQNYEAGTLPLNEAAIKSLMKVLRLTRDEVLGRPARRDEEGHALEHPADHYWGEVAIHFQKGDALLLSISYGEYTRLFRQLQDDGAFFHVFSLSNQMVAVRRAAVTDVCLADDASSTFGPEGDAYSSVGIRQGGQEPGFWRIAGDLLNQFHSLVEMEAKYGKDDVAAVAKAIGVGMQDDVEDGLDPSGRDSIVADAKRARETAELLTRRITWQLSVGKIRRTQCWKGSDLSRFSWIELASDPEGQGQMIIVEDPDAQTIFINPDALDYISIPQHLYFAGLGESETHHDPRPSVNEKKRAKRGKRRRA